MEKIEALKLMESEFFDAMYENPAIIQSKFIKSETDDFGELHAYYEVTLEHFNIKRTHQIILTYNFEEEKYGIDYQTSDGDLGDITTAHIMTQLYFDLAFEGLDEKFLG